MFFYDGPISRAIAFEDLLADGKRFSDRLLGAFSDARTWPQLVHIATDGETYGHHRAYGDMALAFALHNIETSQVARLTNYAEYLEKHPPTQEAKIIGNTSWSCAHGIERWRSDCGCNSGGHAGWNQQWRAPLRQAFDWLRDTAAPRYEAEAKKLFENPWQTRDAYIDVVLDRSRENVIRFMTTQAKRELSPAETVTGLKLLELQRYLMLMYTSCGWFFDDLSGIETVQVIQYAGRALQLAGQLFSEDLSTPFLDLLAKARSNLSGTGRWTVYLRALRSARDGRPGKSWRSLRRQLSVRGIRAEHAHLLLRRGQDGIPHIAAGKIAGGAGTGHASLQKLHGSRTRSLSGCCISQTIA